MRTRQRWDGQSCWLGVLYSRSALRLIDMEDIVRVAALGGYRASIVIVDTASP